MATVIRRACSSSPGAAPMRLGLAISPSEQTGQSDEIHSPEEWASTVFRLMMPAV